MTIIATEILVDSIDVKKRVTLGVQFFQLRAIPLGEDGVTGVAIAGADRP